MEVRLFKCLNEKQVDVIQHTDDSRLVQRRSGLVDKDISTCSRIRTTSAKLTDITPDVWRVCMKMQSRDSGYYGSIAHYAVAYFYCHIETVSLL